MSACTHNGPSLTVTSQGLEIYGASCYEAEEFYYKFDLIISLGVICRPKGKENQVKSVLRSIGLQKLIGKKNDDPEKLYIDWPDYSIPGLSKTFWTELSRILKKKGRDRYRRNKMYKVLVHCQGGHGRTGTALSLLGHFVEGWDEELIEKTRDIHCMKSVEASCQIKYIEEMTGIKSKVKISKSFGHGMTSFISTGDSIDYSYGVGDGMPPNMCRGCKILKDTLNEAIECEKKHREEDKKEREEKKEEEKLKSIIAGTPRLLKAKKDEASKEEKDEYFKNRNKWRKDYPIY